MLIEAANAPWFKGPTLLLWEVGRGRVRYSTTAGMGFKDLEDIAQHFQGRYRKGGSWKAVKVKHLVVIQNGETFGRHSEQ